MKCPVLVNLPQSPGLWESGNPAGFAGFPSWVGKSFFDFSIQRLFQSPSRRHFSAACHPVIFFAFAREMTSCTFIARSIAGLRVRQHTVHALLLSPPQSGHLMRSTTLAVSLACSRDASRDSPAAKGDPLWEWAASVSWRWPPWVLLPELEQGLESPPKPPPYRDSESVIARPPIRTPGLCPWPAHTAGLELSPGNIGCRAA